jgi:uncharacterized protein (TIGR03083 family)
MDVATYIEAVQVEGARLAAAAAAAEPDAPVPTCPEWAVRDLVFHVGAVHRWVTEYVRRGHTEPGAVDFAAARGPAPDDAGLVDWFLTGHAALVAALRGAPPDLRCWTFLPAPSPLAFWARRQAHEITIHRVDSELAAAATVSRIDSALAADGIDEMLVGFASTRGRASAGDQRKQRNQGERDEIKATVIEVRCTDESAGWTVRLGSGGVAATATEVGSDMAADCTVRGTSVDIYMTLWRRGSPAALRVEGDGRGLELLLERSRI